MNIGVSVVLCCYNSVERLPKTLEYLANQALDEDIKWELIIVDNNSKDGTSTIALQEWERHNFDVKLKIVFECNPGLTNARKKGVLNSNYDIVLFCDDDNWLAPNYVNDAYKLFLNDKKIGVVGGKGKAITDKQLPEWFNTYEQVYACGAQAKKSGYVTLDRNYLYGAGLACRKELIQRIFEKPLKLSDRKGNSLSSGGDSEICLKIALMGYELYYDEQLEFEHYLPSSRLSFKYLEKLFESIGKSQYHLYPMQVQLLQKLDYTPKYPTKMIMHKLKCDFKAILYYLFTKKQFSLTLKGAHTWGISLEYFKNLLISR